MARKLFHPQPLKPLVVIASDRVERYGHQSYSILQGYVDAVSKVSGAFPLALPSEPEAIDVFSLVTYADGIILSGSPSNIAPHLYGGLTDPDDKSLDQARDATIIPILRQLVSAGIPILGVCRGFQEMNVAWGGTLDIAVHERPGAIDHREGDRNRPISEWYRDSHSIEIVTGGLLSSISNERHAQVNSLHHQGIRKLGDGLRVEAIAPDGLVEAFSVAEAESFALAVQWHPEMRVQDSNLARDIFKRFGDACYQRSLLRAKLYN